MDEWPDIDKFQRCSLFPELFIVRAVFFGLPRKIYVLTYYSQLFSLDF